jgi:hypothetical protein
MPKYRITGPDGGTYEVNAPEGATEAQVMAYAQANYKPKAEAEPLTPGSPEDDAQRRARGVPTDAEYSASIQRMNSEDPLADENPFVIQGIALNNSLRNTGMGLLQANAEGTAAMVDNPITRGVAGAIGLGDEQRALASVTQGRADQLRQGQEDYERVTESRLQNNPVFRQSDTTFDVAQAVVPGMGAARATQGASLLGRLGADAAVGGLQAGTTALGEGESRAGEAGVGAGLGALGTAAGAAIGRGAAGLSDQIRPAVREMYDAVRARGIQPSISGLLDDGALKTTAEFLQALPFAGGARAINRELGEFTNAVGRTFGLNERELSRAAMDRAENALSSQYDATLQGRDVMLDTDFVRRASQILRDAPQSIDAPQRAILNQNVMRLINAAQTGAMPATLYQELRGVLAQNARRTGAQGVSDHILDLRRALDDAAVRSIARIDPTAANALMGLNRAWANMTKAQEMLSTTGGKAGIVSPKTAASATKPSTSATAGPRSTTSMRNLAEAAERTGVGSGSRELPWWQKLTAGGAAAAGGVASLPVAAAASLGGIGAGRALNSRAGSRYLAEGLPPAARALAERLGLLARAAPAATTRAKKRKELKK